LLAEVLRLGAGALLAAAAIAKLASPATSRAALSTFGIDGARAQLVAWSLLIAAELGLGIGVALGSDTAAVLAAALMATFAATMVSAILRGRAGAPCACFGARSTVSRLAVVRNAVLAAGFAALPLLPDESLTTDQWLGLGLGLALIVCAGLAVAVFALAREVGMLRLRLGPSAALEIPEEGPALGTRVEIMDALGAGPETRLGLAVFSSEGCHVCEALVPAVATLAGDDALAVATFEEAADAEVWAALDIPGSPFAVALDADGTVLAKGAFNNLAQLESVLATAGRRRDAAGIAGGLVG